MAEGRLRSEWGRTSAVLATLANTARDPKRRPAPYTAAEFDPFATSDRAASGRREVVATMKMRDLKGRLSAAFPDRGSTRPRARPGG